MISPKDVITLKVPFPTIDDGLAQEAHMYICYENSEVKKLIKAQSFKPLLESTISNYIDSNDFLYEHPFRRRTLIDLDKYFLFKDILIPLSLKATNNNGVVSDNIFSQIGNQTSDLLFCKVIDISPQDVKKINYKVK